MYCVSVKVGEAVAIRASRHCTPCMHLQGSPNHKTLDTVWTLHCIYFHSCFDISCDYVCYTYVNPYASMLYICPQ